MSGNSPRSTACSCRSGWPGPGPVIASGVVARWFTKRRGTALSVLGSASMTGMSLLVPAVTWLILTTNWRITYVVIAGIVLALVDAALPLGPARLAGVDWADAGRRSPGGRNRPGADRARVRRRRDPDIGLLAARGLVLHLRLLDEPALRARHPHAHRPRLHAHVRVVGAGRARRVDHRVHDHAGRAVRSVRASSRAGLDLRGPHLHLHRALPHPRQRRPRSSSSRSWAASPWPAPAR